MFLLAVLVILGYLIGAIPFGLIISRLHKNIDVRHYGSGKTGATNVLRTAGVLPGLLVLVFDMGKAVGSVYLARLLLPGHNIAAVATALATIAGHVWPVYISFRGGRGVVTYFGGLLALSWMGAAGGAIIVLSTIALTRYVSLGSLLGAVGSLAVVAYLVSLSRQPLGYLVYAAVGTALLIWLHRDNLARLISGTERKVGQPADHPKQSEAKNG